MESYRTLSPAGSRGHTPQNPPKYSDKTSERALRRLQERLELPVSPAGANASQKAKGSKQPDSQHHFSSAWRNSSESETVMSAVLIHKEDPSDLLAARKCSSTASTLIRLLSEAPAGINVNGSLATVLARKVPDLAPVPGAKSAEDEAMAGLSRQRRYEMNLSRCMDEIEATIEALENACFPAGPAVLSPPAPRFASPTPSQALLSPVRDRNSTSPPRRRPKPQIFSASMSPSNAAFGVDSVDAVEEQCRSIISALTAATELASTEAKDKKMHHLWSQAVNAVSSMDEMKEQMDAMKLELDKTKRKCKELETRDAQETLLKSRVHERAQKGKRDAELQQLRAQFEDAKKENQDLQEELDRIGFQLVSSQVASSSKHVVEARIRQCEGKMADMEQQRVDDLVLAAARVESLEELDRTLVMRTGELKAARAQAGEMMRAASEAKEEAARMTWSLQRMYAAVTESNAHSRAALLELEKTIDELLDKDREVQRLRVMIQASNLTLTTPVYPSSRWPGPELSDTVHQPEDNSSPLRLLHPPPSVSPPSGSGGAERDPEEKRDVEDSSADERDKRDEEDSSAEEQELTSAEEELRASDRGGAQTTGGDGRGARDGAVPEIALERSGGPESEASPEGAEPEWLTERIAERVRRCSRESIEAVPRPADKRPSMDATVHAEVPFTPPQDGEQNQSRSSGGRQPLRLPGSSSPTTPARSSGGKPRLSLSGSSSPITPERSRRASYNLPRLVPR